MRSPQKSILLLIFLVSLAVCSSVPAGSTIPSRNADSVVIAFGSCNNFSSSPNEKSEIFQSILAQQVDVFAWIGDAAYIDNRTFLHLWTPESDPTKIQNKFDIVKNEKNYEALRHSSAAIVGVWDDHDYNKNNGDKTFAKKDIIQQLYLDFIDEPAESHRRSSKHGIYTSYFVGEEQRVKLILLDVRYEKDEETQDMLGTAQWEWLAEELSNKEGSVYLYLIASGTQIIPDDRLLQEQWFLDSRRKIISLIQQKQAPVVFLSGDIHQAEIMSMPCSEQFLGYRLREITSSGLSFSNIELDHLFPFFREAVRIGVPETYSMHGVDRYLHRNYGLVSIEWDQSDIMESLVKLQIYGDRDNQPMLMQVYSLRDFHPNKLLIKEEIECDTYNRTPGQRIAANFISMIKQYDPVAIIVIILAALITQSFFGFVKKILFLCCGGSQRGNSLNKIKKD